MAIRISMDGCWPKNANAEIDKLVQGSRQLGVASSEESEQWQQSGQRQGVSEASDNQSHQAGQ